MALLQAIAIFTIGVAVGFIICGLLTGNALTEAQRILDEAHALVTGSDS